MRTATVVKLLSIAILMFGTGGVLAASGGGGGGNGSAAESQYKPPPCPKGQHIDPKTGECVPDETSPPPCPKGQHFDPKSGKCVPDETGPCFKGELSLPEGRRCLDESLFPKKTPHEPHFFIEGHGQAGGGKANFEFSAGFQFHF